MGARAPLVRSVTLEAKARIGISAPGPLPTRPGFASRSRSVRSPETRSVGEPVGNQLAGISWRESVGELPVAHRAPPLGEPPVGRSRGLAVPVPQGRDRRRHIGRRAVLGQLRTGQGVHQTAVVQFDQ
jgi:hypothetical protein